VRVTHRLSLLLAVLVLALAGCGEEVDTSSGGQGGGPGGERESFPSVDTSQGALADSVPLADAAVIAEARDRIENVCRGVVSDADRPANVRSAVDEILGIYRQYGPEVYFESGDIDTRKLLPEVVREAADDLRACGEPQAADRLLQAI
jgi:hypothetical protein